MRHLTDFDSRERTELFVAYLVTLGVSTNVEQESGTPPRWSVWIREEDKLELANAECKAFLESPNDPKYSSAVQQAREILQQQRLEQRQREKNIQKLRSRGGGSDPYSRGSLPPITLVLVVVCVVMGFATNFLYLSPSNTTGMWIYKTFRFVDLSLFEQTKDPAASIKQLELWRIFSPALLHQGPIHLLVNMFSLASLGRLAERMEGRSRYIAILILTAIGAHLLQGLAPPVMFGLSALGGSSNFVGISGVVLGLFGYLAVKSRLRPQLGFSFPPDSYFMVGFILVAGLAGFMPLANLAHIGGLLSGAFIGYIWNR